MIFEIEISEQADMDLRGIYEYIAFELQVPQNASGLINQLEESIMSLEHMPQRFCEYEIEPWKSRGLRMMVVDNYCVLYIPYMEQKIVSIVRVMYSRRDIDSRLNVVTQSNFE